LIRNPSDIRLKSDLESAMTEWVCKPHSKIRE
jgi:hypothetical protein